MKNFKIFFFSIELSILLLRGIEVTGIPQKLPKAGLTACSTYQHAPVLRSNNIFKQGPCFIQKLFIGPAKNTANYKCGYATIVSGYAVIVGQTFTPPVGGFLGTGKSSTVFYDKTTNASIPSNYYYVDLAKGEALTYTTNPATGKLTKTIISVTVTADRSGYGLISCAVNLNKPVCSYITAAFVCTFDRTPNCTAIDKLLEVFKKFPLYNEQYMNVMDQTEVSCASCCRP